MLIVVFSFLAFAIACPTSWALSDLIRALSDLKGKVALVTGGTRGIGKGIALGLAERGCTVYVSGRSKSQTSLTEKELGGTLLDVEKEITELGGIGIGVQCDHRVDQEVEELFGRILKEQGKLDILVNNAFQVPSRPDGVKDSNLLFQDFWTQPGWFWDAFMNVGLRSHYVASCYAVPAMRLAAAAAQQDRKPLIVHVSSFGGASYSFNVAYGVGKAGVDRMARDMQKELLPLGIRCISLYPGVVRTERMVDMLDSGEFFRKTGLQPPSVFIESPMLMGRVVAALYSNGQATEAYNGKVAVAAEVAKKFNILDPTTGITPPSIRSLKFLVPSIVLKAVGAWDLEEDKKERLERWLVRWVPDLLLPMSLMEGGAPSPPAPGPPVE